MSTQTPLIGPFRLKPLKFIAPLRGEKVDVVPADGEYLGLEQFESWTGKLSGVELQQPPDGGGNRFLCGDVLFGKLRPYLAKAWVANRSGYCTGESLVLSPQGADSRYVRYCLLTDEVISAIDGSTYGSKMPRADWGFIGGVNLPFPPPSEQERIANFLDDKAARIDALIAEKERLVERIAEMRNSEFSNAITFGLRPGVKTCFTENPALPEIPVGWKLSRLKWVCSLLRDGTHTPPPRVDVGVPLLSVRNVQKGEFTFLPDDSLISEADYLELNRSFEVRQGDVLLAVVGATMGKVAEVRDMGRPFQIQRSLAVMRPKESEIGATLLAAAIRSEYFQNLLWQNTGFSAQPGTYLGALADFPVPIPPLKEQQEIVAYLARKKRDFDNLTEHTFAHIARLREYRSSLISAAVTGQMDISNPESEVA